jgi:hypothetical protein
MNQSALAGKRDSPGAWVWVLPAAYAIHAAEEAFGGGGFMEWMAVRGGLRLTLAQFLGLNLAGLVLLCVAMWGSRRRQAWRWTIVCAAAIILTNGVAHAAISIVTASYVPGLWTGLLLYAPLGTIFLVHAWGLMSRRAYAAGAGTGFAIHGAVLWVVLRMPGFRPG